jgi:hypothetical protein
MDLQQLITEINKLGVKPKEVLRASLYIDYLFEAQTYFKTTLAGTVGSGGLGPDYPFVETAVQSASLLQGLADILDFYLAEAVALDLKRVFANPPGKGWTYRQYFENVILNADAQTYKQNVADFMLRYHTAAYALDKLFLNFKRNIRQACQRIIADQDLLTKFYADLYEDNFSILYLKNIKSTGSDFHKGGKQVLILTFRIVHIVDYGPPITFAPSVEDLKVVYKPSDLEADCLIIGDSAAVNRVVPNFMAASLCEIYNKRLKIIKSGNPQFTGEPLNTYRFLPRNYMSKAEDKDIREAYGYLQYLDYDLSGTSTRFWGGFYPFGESDYLIFKTQNKSAISIKFYRMEGAFTALAGTFSLIDLHIENIRVKQYTPYPIDLEICLTDAVNDIGTTSLLGTAGGITAISYSGQDFEFIIKKPNTPGQASIDRLYEPVYYQNRLWYSSPPRNKQPIFVSRRFLLQGFSDGMTVLRACQQNNEFNPWFTRLNKVVVRYLVYATSAFKAVSSKIYLDNPRAADVNTVQEAKLREFLTTEYKLYAAKNNPGLDPNFLTLTQAQCGEDYLNLDIPVFYRRIGTIDILNSRGEIVDIPMEVVIDNPNPPPPTRKVRVTGIGGVFNRSTFFATDPTDTIVKQGQVQILGGAGFNARQTLLENTIIQGLGNNRNNSADSIVPIDK